MEPVGKLLYVPPDPGGQRAVLIILIYGGEVAPGRIAAEIFCEAGFEIDGEPNELEQEKADARGRLGFREAGSEAGGSTEKREKSGGEKHAVRLIPGKILGCGNERQEGDETDEQHGAGPQVQHKKQRSEHADPAKKN